MLSKKRIGLTLGDPSGIGYEVAIKFIESDDAKRYNITLFADKYIVDQTYLNILNKPINNQLEIVEPDNKSQFNFEYGKHYAECGNASMQYIKKAVQYAMNNQIDAIVTLPINKYSIKIAGYNFAGHTEYLAALTDSEDISMMMVSKDFKIVLATTHLPIKSVSKSLTKKNILTAIKNAHTAGKCFGLKNPKIAVTSLNPHAGDNGVIGDEEIVIIAPAIEEAKRLNIDVYGAFSADTIYLDKSYDFFVAMYHDQALIPIKLNSFGEGVNVTLGLPIIRTSVDHGTAFDIAGKGIAKTSSLKTAIDIATQMIEYKQLI